MKQKQKQKGFKSISEYREAIRSKPKRSLGKLDSYFAAGYTSASGVVKDKSEKKL